MIERQSIIANAANGAISIIRLSGSRVIELLDDCFFSKNKNEERTLRYGTFKGGGINDKVMAVYFKGPKSYTGEDMVEIHAHGGSGISGAIIRYFIEKGVNLAKGGEFSKRAFLNGKIDLSKAEGVLSLINASTTEQVKNAFALHNGILKIKIDEILIKLKMQLSKMSAYIDYPEEGIEEDTIQELKQTINAVYKDIEKLKDSYSEGELIKNGVDVVLTGDVNVGKSQLMNVLTNNDSAIVTDIAGTTRDIIKDNYEYKGYKFNVFDTAGIRESSDIVEKIGIDKAKQQIQKADIILNIIKIGDKNPKELKENEILIENKIDLIKDIKKSSKTIQISALKNINIDILKQKIFEKSINTINTDIVLTEKRHYDCVYRGYIALKSGLDNIENINLELIYSDLMTAYYNIGEITGASATDDIIDEVFKNFCVGK
ncbi:MAG: tRNA uridine-5-carboxymethylaminomethyl(34) synthesis GTPase MnmE [Firmicutes bacterium]|nr:tRNA uridine-5-carboxymethylaminomethyl(34) synthesis GTPase MnmE [Bacillota bacterium]